MMMMMRTLRQRGTLLPSYNADDNDYDDGGDADADDSNENDD